MISITLIGEFFWSTVCVKMSDHPPAVVIDTGSGTTKAGKHHHITKWQGFSGDDAPKLVFPTIVAKDNDFFIGQDAVDKKNIEYPIQRGIVKNWEHYEKIIHHVFTKLEAKPEEQPVILNEVPLTPKLNKEQLTQVLFENINVPGMFLSNQGVLALYSYGRISGTVLESGYGVTHVIPVFEGYALSFATEKIELAGKDLSDYLESILKEKNVSVSRSVIDDIKERYCYAPLDYNAELKKVTKQTVKYTLPDGKHIQLGEERLKCVEPLFKPSLCGIDTLGVHETLVECINKCDFSMRREMYRNIVLSGGSTMFENLDQRLIVEMSNLMPTGYIPKVIAETERKYAVWIGGNILASLPSFSSVR